YDTKKIPECAEYHRMKRIQPGPRSHFALPTFAVLSTTSNEHRVVATVGYFGFSSKFDLRSNLLSPRSFWPTDWINEYDQCRPLSRNGRSRNEPAVSGVGGEVMRAR